VNTKPNDEQTAKPLYRDPNLQIIFGVTLMAVLGVSSITPVFPRIARVFGLPSQTVGLLITAFTLPGVLLAPVLGVCADRWGRKRILAPSLLLFGVAGAACSLARDFSLLVGLRFLQGIGAAALGSLNVTVIGDLYQGRNRATAMGYNASVLSVGTASYPAIGGALATLEWYYPFALPVLAIPLGLLVIFGLDNPEPENAPSLRGYLGSVWDSIREQRVVAVFLASLVTFILLYGVYLTYLPFLMEDFFGATALVIGLAMSAMSLVTAAISSQLGRLVQLTSKRTLVQIAFLFYAAGLLLMPLAPAVWMLLFPLFLFGVGHGLNIPGIQTLLAELAPMEHRGAFMSMNGMVLRLGQTLGPLIMGLVFGIAGMAGVFAGGAAFAVAMALLASVLLE
jgi:MFS transporter, ACDE family, multidrug resistance protein